MDRARLIITAITTEHITHAEAARRYGVSTSWVSKLMSRYRSEGDAAFTPHSRRPHTSPTRTPKDTRALILDLRHTLSQAGHDAGAHTIAWHLDTHHNVTVSPATIWRILRTEHLITPQPQKRPRSSYIRFQAALPNETWQSDFTHYRLDTGQDTEIITWLDDHSRYVLHVTAHHRITATIVLNTFLQATSTHGTPASTLTDNGMVYTSRLAAGRRGRNSLNALETHLAHHGIRQKNSTPGHPTTCGKVERFQQTLKKWLRQQTPTTTLEQLQHHLNNFVNYYNTQRPHRSLNRHTPAHAYTALAKATPAHKARSAEARVRHDIVDSSGSITFRYAGKLHHIGIGRAHKNTPILMLIDGLQIRVVNPETGELVRELTLDTTRDYQPQNDRKPPNP